MVLYLDKSERRIPREGIYLCLREDKESALTAEDRTMVKEALAKEYGELYSFTTTVGGSAAIRVKRSWRRFGIR